MCSGGVLYRVRFTSIPLVPTQAGTSLAAGAAGPSPAIMLRLRSCILTRLLSSPVASPVPPLHRLLSAAAAAGAAAPTASPNPNFAVEDYLVGTCGLTRAQALKASTKLSHLKSPANPNAVRAFLVGLGLSSADVAAAVAKDPQLLCAGVERTLAPVVVGLTGLGLSNSEIARLVLLAPGKFRCRSVVPNLQYYLHLFGSFENLLRALKFNIYLLSYNLERIVKPNVTFLRECGLGACDIAKLCIPVRRLLISKPERLQAMVACAEGLGVPRGSGMFWHALQAVALLSEEKIAAQVENLKNLFRWSDVEVRIAVSKLPIMLIKCKDDLQSRSEFLISEVGLEPAYIAHRLTYSLEGRLKPRYYAVKFLKENGLLDHKRDYYSTFAASENIFVEKFIYRHKKAAPHLAEDYAAACRGEGSTNFRST